MGKWMLKLLRFRIAYLRSAAKVVVIWRPVHSDPFGDYVMVPMGYGTKTRVGLNDDGTTDFSAWPEWRGERDHDRPITKAWR